MTVVLFLQITKALPVHSSALNVSFVSLTVLRTFIYSYGDVPGSQMAAAFGTLTTRAVQCRRHGVSDTQF